jgi:hypothetical protein
VTETNLKTDVIGIWTDTRITVQIARSQGREKREWHIILGVYFGLTALVSILAKLNGADNLLGYFTNDDTDTSGWSDTVYMTIGIVVFLAALSFIQWIVLPRVSGWFGGSRLRDDASLTLYFTFCAGIAIALATVVIDFLSAAVQQVATPYGSYMAVAWLALLVVAGLHVSARIIESAQFVTGYGRAIGVSLVSFLVAFIPLLLVLATAMAMVAQYFPNGLESHP